MPRRRSPHGVGRPELLGLDAPRQRQFEQAGDFGDGTLVGAAGIGQGHVELASVVGVAGRS